MMKVAASDYDGTLFRQDRIAKSDAEAIKKWREAEHKFGVVSGRDHGMLVPQLQHYGVGYDYLACNNGGIICAADGTVLWENQAAGINTNRLCIASTAENPELLARWADYLYTPDNSIQEIWGQFETHTRKNEDGSWTRIAPPEGVNGDEWLLQTSTRGLPALLTDQMVEKFDTVYPDGSMGSKRTDLKYKLSSVYANEKEIFREGSKKWLEPKNSTIAAVLINEVNKYLAEKNN